MPEKPKQSTAQGLNLTGHGTTRYYGEKPKLNNVKDTVKRMISYMAEKRKALILVFLCALAVTSITIGAARLYGYVIDVCISEGNITKLFYICILVGLMHILGAVSSYSQKFLMVRISQEGTSAMRKELFERVQRLPLSYIDTHPSGDLMSRLTNDIDNINSAMTQNVIKLFSGIISIAGMLIAMILLSPLLTGVCLFMIPVTCFITKSIARFTRKYVIKQQRGLGELNGYTEEMISGIKVIKQFAREDHVINIFDQYNEKYMKNSFVAQAVNGFIGPFTSLVHDFAYLLVAVAGGICIIKGYNAVTVGIVFSFLLYMKNFTSSVNDILNLMNTLQLALASAERVFEVIDEEIEADAANAVELGAVSGDIKIKQVNFSYVPDRPVLKNTSISAEPGQVVAIVGPTGAGKTTIVNLLTRFYNIDEGEILFDGEDIYSVTLTSLRQKVALVLQDMFLFSDTVKENIRFGRLDATDEEIIQAAKKAYAHNFIMQLPKGYDTVLSDGGQNLSQGQRQLLSIARAIISRASILILDEATSSIDTRTEIIVQSALLELMKGKTSFVIAHRLSTIRNADRIVVINDGQVQESGTHDELVAADGFYAHMYNSQFKAIS